MDEKNNELANRYFDSYRDFYLPFDIDIMAEVIRDGTGSGFEARVDSNNRLWVDSVNSKVSGEISTGNSTTVILPANGSFVGAWEEVKDYSIIYTSVRTDEDSENGTTYGFNMEFSQDAGSGGVDVTEEYFVSSGTGKIFSTQPSARYFRVNYINGANPQGLFRLQTLYRPNYGKPSSHRIDEPINDQNDAELTKAVITGKKASGEYTNFNATNGGNFKISLEEYEPNFFNGSPLPVNAAQSGTWDIANITNSVTPGTASANLGKADSLEFNQGDTGVFMLGVTTEDDAPITDASNKYGRLSIDQNTGRLKTSLGDETVNTNPSIGSNAILGAGNIGPLTLDNSTHAINQIDYEHHEIHTGAHYFVRGYDVLASSGDTMSFGLTTPNGSRWVHLVFSIQGNDIWSYKEFEGATISGGNSVNVFNSNRNSTKTSDSVVVANPSASASGTLIAEGQFGQAGVNPNRQGLDGGDGRNNEVVLKSGTTYLWEFQVGANTTTLSWDAEWYEHTDKTQVF